MKSTGNKDLFSPMDFSTIDGWLQPVRHEAPTLQPSPDGTYILDVFKEGSMWTFHTPCLAYPGLPKRDLEDNALVAGIDLMLDAVAAKYGNFRLLLSDHKLTNDPEDWLTIHLQWVSGDRENLKGHGNTYEDASTGAQGWLCSVLFDYYPGKAPSDLWMRVIPLGSDR